MLGQSSPRVVRLGLWALPAAASVMGAMAAPDPARTVIYALTPMGMSVSAEGMAFLARRIVVHTDGRDAEHERRTADLVQALAYHRARAAQHPSSRVQWWSERKSWRLARRIGVGDTALGCSMSSAIGSPRAPMPHSRRCTAPPPPPRSPRLRMRRNLPRPSGNGLWLTWGNRPPFRP